MLTDLMRQPLLSLSNSDRVKELITGLPASKAMVDRYVPGEQVADAVAAAQALRADSLRATIDYLGEDITEPAQAEHTCAVYLELLTELAAADLTADGWVEVSVKLSALGAKLSDGGPALAQKHLRQICAKAKSVGTTVTVDMEDHTTTSDTLAMVTSVRADFPDVGAVLQAYLMRTNDDCEQMAVTDSRTRLCKGAYNEPESVAYQAKADVDANYVRCLATLMARSGRPMVASHDPRIIAIAETFAAHNNRGNDDWEIQMLYGIRSDEQKRLASLGRQVRVYIPFGDDWYGYLMRRLAERPANMAFFARSLVSAK